MSLYKTQSAKVAQYYDGWNERYSRVYGKNIQAHRPPSDEDLINYTIRWAGLTHGQHILDAGCGNCGPAVSFAEKLQVCIEGVTISEQQVKKAAAYIHEKGKDQQVQVRLGDYHELDELFPENSFDKVLFLESLGHAAEPAKVIRAAYEVLRPGGEIYIKDFYYKVVKEEALQKKIQQVVSNLNHHYSYNVMDLSTTITALREANFEIMFIKQIEFENDASIKNIFEQNFGIDLFEGREEFYFAEWLEIRCKKPIV